MIGVVYYSTPTEKECVIISYDRHHPTDFDVFRLTLIKTKIASDKYCAMIQNMPIYKNLPIDEEKSSYGERRKIKVGHPLIKRDQ